jgi:carbamoyltransferase
VALNCVGNGRLLREGRSSACGSSPRRATRAAPLGVALAIHHKVLGNPRASPKRATHARLVPRAGVPTTRSPPLDAAGAVYERSDEARCSTAPRAARRREGRRLVQGRMEFGPRALGARSILGDRARRRCSR